MNMYKESNLNLVKQLAKKLNVTDENITIIFMPNQEVQISENGNIPTNYDFKEVGDSNEQTEWLMKIKEITLKIRSWLLDGVDVRAILNENENSVYEEMHRP